MNDLQITYKIKKQGRVFVAVIGRGAKRFERGTGVPLPLSCKHENGNVTGDHKDRNKCIADKALWDSNLRETWRTLLKGNPQANTLDLRNFLNDGKITQAGFGATLKGWIKRLESLLEKGDLFGNKGVTLAEGTIKLKRSLIRICRMYLAKYDDFDFGRYNSVNIQALGGRQFVVDKYAAFAGSFKRFLTEECDYGDRTVVEVMNKLRWLINRFSREAGVVIDDDLMGYITSSVSRRKNTSDDIIALDDDLFDFLIENEAEIRRALIYPDQQKVVDYIIVGLLIFARVVDMDSWTSVHFDGDGSNTHLKFTPIKTANSSGISVDVFPIPDEAMVIFKKNMLLYNGKLMPDRPPHLSRGIRGIFKRYPFVTKNGSPVLDQNGVPKLLFDRIIRTKNTKGVVVKKKVWEVFNAHSLRKSGITHLRSQGIDDSVIKQLSGHSANSKSFADSYAKVLDKNRIDPMAALNELRRLKREMQAV